jgi:hypothetical protein
VDRLALYSVETAGYRAITMRVMDFWHAQNDDKGHGLLIENWVMIDVPDLLNQFGIDIFAGMTPQE